MLKHHSILALFAFTSSVLADEANICRITGNYGCQQYGYNCNDVIGDDNVEALQPTALFGAVCPGTKSEDNLICCDTANLNGGYCPNLDEIEKYGFALSGSGSTQLYQMSKGPSVVKCNKVGGPHYCFRPTSVQGEMKCLDEGQYN